MLLRRFTQFILRGHLAACGVAFACAFVPLLGSISILIAGLVTLRKGTVSGMWVMIAATLPTVISTMMTPSGTLQADLAWFALTVVLISNISVWVFTVLLARYQSWNVILELALLVSIVIIGMTHILYPDIASWWQKQLTLYLHKATELTGFLSSDNPLNDMEGDSIRFLKNYATGLVLVCLLLNALLQVVLVRWWQSAVFHPGLLRHELYLLHMDKVAAILFIICFTFSLSGNATLVDILPVFYAIFAAAGLSLSHYLLAKNKLSWLWLMLLYTVLIWVFPLSAAVLAVVAVMDSWLEFRKRLV